MKKIRTEEEYQQIKEKLGPRNRKKLERAEQLCEADGAYEKINEKIENIFWEGSFSSFSHPMTYNRYKYFMKRFRSPLHRLIEYLQVKNAAKCGDILVIFDKID